MTDMTQEIEAPMPERAYESMETRQFCEIKATIPGFSMALDYIFFWPRHKQVINK